MLESERGEHDRNRGACRRRASRFVLATHTRESLEKESLESCCCFPVSPRFGQRSQRVSFSGERSFGSLDREWVLIMGIIRKREKECPHLGRWGGAGHARGRDLPQTTGHDLCFRLDSPLYGTFPVEDVDDGELERARDGFTRLFRTRSTSSKARHESPPTLKDQRNSLNENCRAVRRPRPRAACAADARDKRPLRVLSLFLEKKISSLSRLW